MSCSKKTSGASAATGRGGSFRFLSFTQEEPGGGGWGRARSGRNHGNDLLGPEQKVRKDNI